MVNIFDTILKMSWKATLVILLVLLARLFLKNAPKKYSYLLWAVVAFRLIIPVSFQTPFSIFNITEQANLTPETVITETSNPVQEAVSVPEYSYENNDTVGNISFPENTVSIPAINEPVQSKPIYNEPLNSQPIQNEPIQNEPIVDEPINNNDIIGTTNSNDIVKEHQSSDSSIGKIIVAVWLLGVAVMIAYGIISYTKISKLMNNAVLLRDNIYFSDKTNSPFTLGFVKPKIYLPFGLTEEEQDCVITHENCHIKRFDHIIKLFSFLLLSVHWFNPFCWIAFNRMAYDMETSCDEKVFENNISPEFKKTYSKTLITIGTKKRFPAPSPINFDGISDIKKRITHILNFKKPKTWIKILCVIVCVSVLISCASDVMENSSVDESSEEEKEISLTVTVVDDKSFMKDMEILKFQEDNANYTLKITTSAKTEDFKIVSLDESEGLKVDKILFELDELNPDDVLGAEIYLNDATATRGISYKSADGNIKYFTINVSMNDGSVYLDEFEADKDNSFNLLDFLFGNRGNSSEEPSNEPNDPNELKEFPNEPKNWDEQSLLILSYNGEYNYHTIQIAPESETNDPVTNAMYERNSIIKNEYGINIDVISPWSDESVQQLIREDIMSTLGTYDAVVSPVSTLAPLVDYGLFRDFNELDNEYLHLNESWWDQNIIEDLAVNDKVYFLTGDALLGDDESTWAVYFNKDHFDNDANLKNALGDYESIYDIVRDGKWTLDKMYELSQAFTKGTGTNKSYNKALAGNCKYGMLTQNYDMYLLMQGAEQTMVDNTGDVPILRVEEKENIDAFNKIMTMFLDSETVGNADYNGSWSQGIYQDEINVFANGNALFMPNAIAVGQQPNLIETDINFDILPMPKYNDSQKEYCSPVNVYHCAVIAIPITSRRVDTLCYALEAMAYYGQKLSTPQYYNRILRYADAESTEMLDLIFSNRIYDLAAVYNFHSGDNDGTLYFYSELVAERNTNILQRFQAKHNKYFTGLETFVSITYS